MHHGVLNLPFRKQGLVGSVLQTFNALTIPDYFHNLEFTGVLKGRKGGPGLSESLGLGAVVLSSVTPQQVLSTVLFGVNSLSQVFSSVLTLGIRVVTECWIWAVE